MPPADPPPRVDLRPLARADLPKLSTWLQEPEVARWWCDPWDLDALEAHYGPSIDGTDPTHVLVCAHQGRDVGLVQWFRLADEPAYAADLAGLVAVAPGAVSTDYLIGEPDARGLGVADAMIAAVLDRARAAGATEVVVAVHRDNTASWRLLERCGLVRVGEIELEPDNPAHSRAHLVHRLDLV